MKMVVLCVATLWVTTKNAPFSDRNKSFQTFLKTFEIASGEITLIFSLSEWQLCEIHAILP